ncbi:galactose mutarotase [Bacteroides uniformis]|jgi:aldose 1-epimerase|uniref:aldose epimerase family protein n=1 Tax=Bacteroides uniformis TaxID=820 RepID=UPI000E51EBF1|nr:aldose epimerase family protein [Bacteroides uniformis]RHE35033.1 galactose mutarotase [Bacteroides uniformis]RHI00327.1 galactose mutarotase [Bacteroides uniformis]
MNKMMTLLASVMLLASACTGKQASEKTASGLEPANFRTEVDGKQTDLFVLKNKNGMEVCITNFGGRIVSVMVPDKDGVMRDVVLGFDSIQDYIKFPSDFGATIGRYANRINQGKITVDGVEYQLPRNNYGHCLHGGPKGYQYQVFDARQLSNQVLELTYLSKDGEEGFPGNLTCKVTFSLTDDDAIDIRYSAETDRTTVVNMTNHSYFNLDGDPSKSNLDYLLTIDADAYTPVDSTFMTTGEIVSVEGTDMDFRTPTAVGARIDNDFEQLKNGKGYDHNWVLNTKGDITRPCATLESPVTGIVLDVYTNEPGIQIYAGNFLDGTLTGKKGIVYGRRASVCLETQKYPDTPNKPEWPSALLKPGEKYDSHCIYRFSVKK